MHDFIISLRSNKIGMYDFLLQMSFFLSLGVILYLMARALPRVDEVAEVHHAPGPFDRLLSKLPLKKIDERLDLFFEKFLRRLKVLVMRIDNAINSSLSRFKKSNGNGTKENKPDLFQDLNSDKKE